MNVLEFIISKGLQCPDAMFSFCILKCYVTEESKPLCQLHYLKIQVSEDTFSDPTFKPDEDL